MRSKHNCVYYTNFYETDVNPVFLGLKVFMKLHKRKCSKEVVGRVSPILHINPTYPSFSIKSATCSLKVSVNPCRLPDISKQCSDLIETAPHNSQNHNSPRSNIKF